VRISLTQNGLFGSMSVYTKTQQKNRAMAEGASTWYGLDVYGYCNNLGG